jgi:ADP-ribosylglycohydrolase
MNIEDRIRGSLFGLAYGDAIGAPTEFLSVDEILKRWPPNGPFEFEGDPIRVTDDTQMMLAVGEALIEAKSFGTVTANTLERPLRDAFIKWLHSPDNNRAPGMTCLRACEDLDSGMPWYMATVTGSKGCGANMRVTPVGLVGEVTEEMRAAIAQYQAAFTHGHPTALTASDLTAYTITRLINVIELDLLIEELKSYALSQRNIYHKEWLGPLWERPGATSPKEFINRGWDECLVILERVKAALINPSYKEDPCLLTGAGWTAEEAFATGLYCFLIYPDEPRKALQRAATTSGDSDSIACLTGAFIGAHLGDKVWPKEWKQRIEYRERIERLSLALH